MSSIIVRWDRGGPGFHLNIFSFLVAVYFFLNSTGLPHGLLYTSILAPVFYLWLWKKGEKWIIFKFLIFLSPFILIHLVLGIENRLIYIRSFILFISIYITIYAAAVSLKNNSNLEKTFDKIIIFNFIFACLAVILLGTQYTDLMWTVGKISTGIYNIARLRMFSYEPSYYATLLVPFMVYAITNFIYSPTKRSIGMAIGVLIPLALSFSFGIISALTIAIFIAIIYKKTRLIQKPMVFFIVILAISSILFIFNTDNLFTQRLHNVLSGIDSSSKNRIFESTDIGYQVAQKTNLFFGAGFGQVKLYLPRLFDVYWKGLEINRLTNAFADTIATLGIIGGILRLSAEILLFFRTRVYTDFFRLTLFLFIFIYQFTGSYMTNLAEYVIWLFAFCPFFIEKKTLNAAI